MNRKNNVFLLDRNTPTLFTHSASDNQVLHSIFSFFLNQEPNCKHGIDFLFCLCISYSLDNFDYDLYLQIILWNNV